eukprot:CFRG3622T1
MASDTRGITEGACVSTTADVESQDVSVKDDESNSTCSTGSNSANEFIYNEKEEFQYPLLMIAMGQTVSSIIAILTRPWMAQNTLTTKEFVTIIIPLSGMTAAALGMSGAVYLFLSVSFIQMLKAASPINVMLVMYLFGILKPTYRLIISVLVICSGCLLAANGEVSFSVLGVSIFFVSDILDSIRSVWTETLLGRMALMDSLYYLCPASAIWLVIFAAFDEIPRFAASNDMDKILASPFLYFIYSCMGFVVQISVLAVISETSTLTLKIVGQVKNIATIVGGVLFIGNSVSNLQILAYLIESVGFWLYQRTMIIERTREVVLPEQVSDTTAPLLDEGQGSFGAQHRDSSARDEDKPVTPGRWRNPSSTRFFNRRTYSTLSQYSRYSIDDEALEDRMEGRLQGH